MIKRLLETSREMLTFDDVLLEPGFSEVTPKDVSVRSIFSKNIPLQIPISSSAMDTVTEYTMAIELAQLGGIGIIHKNLSPDEQADQVARVKHHLNAFIEDPKCVYEDETVGVVLSRRRERGWERWSSFPVLDRDNKLTGVVTGNDFDFCNDPSRKIREIMTTDPLQIIGECSIEEAHARMTQNKKKLLPVVDTEGKLVGIYVFSDVRRVLSGDVSSCNLRKGRLIVGAAIGVINDEKGNNNRDRLEKLVGEHVDVIVIDTAHGHSAGVGETLKLAKRLYPQLDIVAGNVATRDGAKYLADCGADAIKVGIGPGRICTTRVISGVGVPQISAVYNCTRAVEDYGIPIIADGGLRHSGDITKAIAAGASSVMMGGILAGTEETPGDKISWNGRLWKSYRGMGSLEAMQDNRGSRERYRQEDSIKLVPEGIDGLEPYKGKVGDLVFQIIGGLRAGMGYVGAKDIKELREKAVFILPSKAGVAESHPHDIVMTHDAPNYFRCPEGQIESK